VLECLETSWISARGRFVAAFESQFAAKVGARHGLATCNGTAALHLAVAGLGLGPGDEVIVPTLTYVASANARCLYRRGARVCRLRRGHLADRSGSNSLRHHAANQSDHGGAPLRTALRAGSDSGADASPWAFVIEDWREAFGASYKGRPVGAFGDVAAFSFFGNKTITTGEGGMVVSNDGALIEHCRRLRGQGLVPGREYWARSASATIIGCRMSRRDRLAQLERADELVRLKRQLAQRYFERLSNLPLKFHREAPDTVHAYWDGIGARRSERRAR